MSLNGSRAAHAAVLAALLVGCSCDAPAVEPPRAPDPAPAEPPRASLPSASRSDLGAVMPMVTVEVTEDELRVSNTALLGTWPPSERDALARAQPLGDARWPEVEERVRVHGDDLAIPRVRDAFAHVSNVDHARAALSGGTGTPVRFALRAGPDVRFIRVLQAIYAAGLTGYAEPQLVLSGATSEVVLPLPLPRAAPAHEADVARDLASALAAAGLEGRTRPESDEHAAPSADGGSSIAVRLEADGLHISRDGHALAPGCVERAEEDVVTITAAELAPSQVSACLEAVGTAPSLTFRTSPDTRYADAVAVLEILAARGAVGLAVAR